MKIIIENKIKIDQQFEQIKETVEGQFVEKNEQILLRYLSAEEEKVMIKISPSQMSMTRYTSPAPVTMRFTLEQSTFSDYQGLGKLEIKTYAYQLNQEKNELEFAYHLAQNEQIFGDYQMKITWEN